MNLFRISICLLIASLLLWGDQAMAAPAFSEAGKRMRVRVKRQKFQYQIPARSGAWKIKLNGPSKLTVGLRMPVRGRRPAKGTLKAVLDADAEISVKLSARMERRARVRKARRMRLSQEQLVTFDIPAGEHELLLKLDHKRAKRALARILEKHPKSAIQAPPFPQAKTPAVASGPSAAKEETQAAKVSAQEAARAGQAETEQVAATVREPEAGQEQNEQASAAAAQEPAERSDSGAEAKEKQAEEEVEATMKQDKVLHAAPVEAETLEAVSLEKSDAAQKDGQDSKGLTLPISAGLKFGGQFPQLVSKLGSSINASVQLGAFLPVLENRLAVVTEFSYIQPGHDNTVSDPRLSAAQDYEFNLSEQEMIISLAGLYRFFPPKTKLNFYGIGGVRLDLQRSNIDGSVAGSAFGENTETKTSYGFYVGGGVEYYLVMGAVFAEVNFGFADLSHRVTGDVSIGGLGFNAGYVLMF